MQYPVNQSYNGNNAQAAKVLAKMEMIYTDFLGFRFGLGD
jgi:hypothetical protein